MCPPDGRRRAHRPALDRRPPDRRPRRAPGFLERDRLFAAYALCDLEDREWARSHWGAAWRGDELIAVALEYAGLSPQPLFVMGDADGIEAILHEVIRPRVAYVAALPADLPPWRRHYRVDPGASMVRMWVDRAPFPPLPVRRAQAPRRPTSASSTGSMASGFASWLPASADQRGRLLRDEGGRPARRGRRHARHQPQRPARRSSATSSPTTSSVAGATPRPSPAPSRRSSCGRATRSCSTSAPTTRRPSTCTGGSATRSTAGSTSASSTASARRGPTSLGAAPLLPSQGA